MLQFSILDYLGLSLLYALNDIESFDQYMSGIDLKIPLYKSIYCLGEAN